MHITFLCPRLPPKVCGVGDHTIQLAQKFVEQGDRVSAIYTEEQCVNDDLPFVQTRFSTRQQRMLCEAVLDLRSDWLWVQYSGYGFSRYSTPWFLSRAMTSLRKSVSVAVFMHETHCAPHQLGWKGRILSPLQRAASRRVVHAADVVFVSAELYQRQILHEYCLDSDRLIDLPLGSNIPFQDIELHQRRDLRKQFGWNDEETVAVVFGSIDTQLKALDRYADILRYAFEQGSLHKVICVGGSNNAHQSSVEDKCRSITKTHFQVMGRQPETMVANVLVAADVAFSRYEPERFGKSGAFIAYSLAGLPVLVHHRTAHEYRHARLLTAHELTTLNNPAEHEARVQRQMLAKRDFGWSSITSTAREALLCRMAGRSRQRE